MYQTAVMDTYCVVGPMFYCDCCCSLPDFLSDSGLVCLVGAKRFWRSRARSLPRLETRPQDRITPPTELVTTYFS